LDGTVTTSERARGRRLLARWERLLPRPSRMGSLVGENLLARWSAPARRYHDTVHLGEVLDRLNRLPGGREAPVRLAAWFHDAVYEPTAPPGASEQASAALLEELGPECGFDPPVVAEAIRLVRLTSLHESTADDVAAAALMDADLAILAADPDRYLDYAAGVRAEYAHLADDAFAVGRTRVLQGLLEHDPLFVTAIGRARWEAAARANVAVELRMLNRS
jgi:predicted metal-dependent HD superfamily phosphohydrolase